MERTVRSALIKQMQRIRNDIRENDEQYEARLGLDGGLEAGSGLRVLGQPGKQWRAQIARIASQLVDAAELNAWCECVRIEWRRLYTQMYTHINCARVCIVVLLL